ncbi:nuclear transport factor 2 family protein [Oceanibium sediminis]|uniref:nuclear transport factor 2 family protein n=1 Tax=Oceanibium sediminis TaxID=2026339 RepID=UPI0013003EFA|nr:nuclear transport factor 2 family protein [Oceanibium sediminis]
MTDTLETRLRAIEDRLAIADIIAGYGPAADALDEASLGADWAEDATYTAGEHRFEGRAAIAGITGYATHQGYVAQGCAHVLGPHRIEVDGDTATARGHSVVFLHDAPGWRAERVSANLWHFARTPEGWRITGRENRLLNGDAAAHALLARP